ncbi:MAG: hypothetical protein HPY44_17785 [Armatimonadetes bacterium]|nr:hypothetical protein [Armatimonadota bacterium]
MSVSPPTQPAENIRTRSIVLGLVLVPLVSLWVAGMENVYGGRPTYLSVFFHAVILLAALIAVNSVLHLVSPRLCFSRMEMLIIYVMIGASSGIVGDQFMAILIPSLSHPFRYATDANRWATDLIPYLPTHAVVGDPVAVRNFYEGDSSLYLAENYRPWLAPGLLWATFIALTQLMCLGVNVIIRRQWTQHKKLSFPLVIMPLEMTNPGPRSIWRNNLLWLGFANSGAIDIINGLSMYFPVIPLLKVKVNWLQFSPRWNGPLTTTGIAFYPFVIGIAYLLPSDLTFSTWFFLLLFRFERFICSAAGYPSPYPWQSTGRSVIPFMLEQGIGSYLAVVAFGLWAGRKHLAAVWRSVWHGPQITGDRRTEIDGAQVVEYRMAFAVIAGGLVLTTLFASSIGMPMYIGVVYLLLYLVINTAITKVRAEAGAPTHGFHFAGPDHILMTFISPSRMPVRTMSAWGLLFGFNRAYTGVPMPHQLEGMKIGEMLGASPQRVTGAIAAATTLGCYAAVWALLHLCFREGVEQMGEPVKRLSPGGWQLVGQFMGAQAPPNWPGLVGIAMGFGFASLLMAMRCRFVWWQFHPIGYAIAADWTTGLIWLPLLLGWGIKLLVMRYLGPKAYRRGLPLFLGLTLGEFAVGGFWSLLAMFTRKPQYFFWT